MTEWDSLERLASSLSPILTMIITTAMGIVFIIGFSKHGIEFIKHGFKQTSLDESLDKRLKDLGESFDKRFKDLDESLGQRIDGLHTELDMIKNNHFGHLKSYLEILDGILLDKNIISNKEKALLDNELKGM
ncbi:MAG: hypothetical protein LBF87_02960 [Treponema sp.]|jgi:hypothetical protein|nr:hypothetical protein [Treponema sp.]